MQVQILGSRGNIRTSAPGYQKHSGILIDRKLLVDIGETEYLDCKPRWIFVSHLHPDHAAVKAADLPEKVPIFAPEPSPRLPAIQVISGRKIVGPYSVTPVPTIHSQTATSFGYVIEKGKTRIFYSSDIIRIAARFHSLLDDLDLVITDGSFIREGGLIRYSAQKHKPVGHNGIPNLIRFFSRFTDCIVITHFGSWFFKDIPKSRRDIESYSNGVHVIAAKDGMRINV